MKNFTHQKPGRGCHADSCTIAVDRKGEDMYSIIAQISEGEMQRMICSSCVQTGPATVSCSESRESYIRYCSVIGKERRVEGNGTYRIEYSIIPE